MVRPPAKGLRVSNAKVLKLLMVRRPGPEILARLNGPLMSRLPLMRKESMVAEV
jgi:hypothetical protein